MKGDSVAQCNVNDFARTIPKQDMKPLLSALAKRPAGSEAILNSPLVVRARTQSNREVRRILKLKEDKKISKFTKQIAQAKGCVTKTAKKLSCAEARNKGLRTMLTKVTY